MVTLECGSLRLRCPSPPGVPDKQLAAVLEEMFARDGYLLSSLGACALCAVGIGCILKGVFGPPYREVQSEEHDSAPGAPRREAGV